MGSSKGKQQVRKASIQQKRGINTEQAIGILEKHGVIVDEKQAEEILDLLYILAKLSVSQYLISYEKPNCNDENS